MLLVLMYHRIGSGKYANSQEMLYRHLEYLKKKSRIVLPGDPLSRWKVSVCLTFDDATYDFYHDVFPILKLLKIRALLGVPVHYILDETSSHPEERLSVPYTLMMQEGVYEKKAPFCTWKELKEMVESGYVEIASHSYLHCNLTFNFVDLNRELVHSKETIENKLAQPVNSFIYPFGKTTPALHEYVAQHYPFAFRIGSALNFGWGKNVKPLSRVSADNLCSPSAPLRPFNLALAFAKGILI